MGVGDLRRAVRRPARVGNAGRRREVLVRDLFGQFRDARDTSRAAQPRLVDDGDAAGVVPAVFESAKSFEQDGNDVLTGRGRDDSAHVGSSFCREFWFRPS